MGTLIINQYLNDADVVSYVAAVESADGQALEGTTKRAINDFVVGCKRDGIWDAIKTSCILAGARTLAGALIPLKGTAPTNYNFVAGDYDRKTGLKGTTENTKYLNTNRLDTADPLDNQHIYLYKTEASSVSGVGLLVAGTGGTGTTGIYQDGYRSRNTNINPDQVNSINSVGLSRSNETEFAYLTEGGAVVVPRPSQGTTGEEYLVFRRSGLLTVPTSDGRKAFYSIGTSLDLTLLDSRVSQLMTDINNAF